MLPFLETKTEHLFLYHFDNFDFPSHFHDGIEIICVTEGNIMLAADDCRHTVKEGEIAVILPNRIHYYEWDGQSKCTGEIMILGKYFLADHPEIYGQTPQKPILPLSDIHPDIPYTLRALLNGSGEELSVQNAYAQLLLCRLLPELRLTSVPHASEEDTLRRLIEYLSVHFREPLTLPAVADALIIDKYRLSRIFSNNLNTHFNDYINRMRVEYAAAQLKTTRKSVTEVAFGSGFDSLCTFQRAFRKTFRTSPGAYRKT